MLTCVPTFVTRLPDDRLFFIRRDRASDPFFALIIVQLVCHQGKRRLDVLFAVPLPPGFLFFENRGAQVNVNPEETLSLVLLASDDGAEGAGEICMDLRTGRYTCIRFPRHCTPCRAYYLVSAHSDEVKLVRKAMRSGLGRLMPAVLSAMMLSYLL